MTDSAVVEVLIVLMAGILVAAALLFVKWFRPWSSLASLVLAVIAMVLVALRHNGLF
ncbi:hypothetical protein [Paracraurococcus lichenis]|uniref:Uncharacterized protein n=1 Tax=Paracraurococcus lichenis TaxID=3064888 RepID=A0ABT9EC52_9PROT|nr:hypothetical protein [Paracraurococcus sp. LOR1-02]MDO9713791.1 hypothetical protein [Paracraurococcus sp. LOR1-02]